MIVRIALQESPLVLVEGGNVVGTGGGTFGKPATIGVPLGTAAKMGIEIRAGKSPAGRTKPEGQLLPVRRDAGDVIGLARSCTHRRRRCRRRTDAPKLSIFGLRVRSMEYFMVAAVTGSPDGGEKWKPLRIVNV